jgi:hypothetical protein
VSPCSAHEKCSASLERRIETDGSASVCD